MSLRAPIAILAISCSVAVKAAPGDLDPSFGASGKVTTPIGVTGGAYDVALQADGKIVVAGVSGGDIAVCRYHVDGSLDTSFDGDGIVTTDVGTSSVDNAQAVAVQPDGKLVVAGYSNAGTNYDFVVLRYTPDGSLDTTFDGDGKALVDFGGNDNAYGLALLPDGKIAVVGVKDDYNFAVARLASDGSLDTTFNLNGKQVTDFASSQDAAFDVAVQSDGKLVVCGESGYDLALARYNVNGSLDTSFGGGDGKVTSDFSGNSDRALALAIRDDGAIVVSGYSNTGSSVDFAVARYLENGTIDTTFGVNGMVTVDLSAGGIDTADGLVILAEGRILVGGQTNAAGTGDFGMVRYRSDGSLDPYFGTGGIVTTDFAGFSDKGRAVALQPDGRLVVVGQTRPTATTSAFGLARYLGIVPRPDLHIGKKIGEQRGDDLYSGNGAGQAIALKSKRNRKLKFFFTAENDGTDPDSVRIRATRSDRHFSIRYHRISPTPGDVTMSVTRGRYAASALVPGTREQFVARIKPERGIRKRKTVRIQIASNLSSGTSDVAKARMKTQP